MKPLDRLSDYLGAIERRLRWLVVSRGAAVIAGAALVLTVAAVLLANHFAFSQPSVLAARVLLFLGLALAIAAALILPLLRLNRRRAAHMAESKYPQFEERLLTFTERLEQNAGDPFLPLLADDTLTVVQQAQPRDVARTAWIFSFSSVAVSALVVLLWLASGPGFLGYGTSLLWGGLPKGNVKPFYSIQVDPGNRTIRKRTDQVVTAVLMGFTAPSVRFVARYASASQWAQADMRPQGGASGYQFLIAGVPESLEYYVVAGGVRSPTYKLNVVDLPSVKSIKVTYHYPEWTGMKDAVEDPGGDLRAVEGTVAEVVIRTDRPLANGTLLLDDGSKIGLRDGALRVRQCLVARVPIQRDGMYHVAAVESGEDVRLSEDYFIEAQKDNPPEISITRPGRDFKASPIEEVTVAVNAKDDFGLRDMLLHYSVNGGPEKTVSAAAQQGRQNGQRQRHHLARRFQSGAGRPGQPLCQRQRRAPRPPTPTCSLSKPSRSSATTRSRSRAAAAVAAAATTASSRTRSPSARRKSSPPPGTRSRATAPKVSDAENAAFLSSVQSKLRDQAKSMSDRMKARQIEEAGDAFKTFVTDLDQAVEQMAPASDDLKTGKWQDALAPEQKALQYLQRAFATFRDIQVAFGQRGGGGGGGGMSGATRDMQGLFDLELDTEKNQYESGRQTQSADARQREVDDMLQKLEQLAKRQQELAEQARQGQQTASSAGNRRCCGAKPRSSSSRCGSLRKMSQLSRNGQQGQQGQQGSRASRAAGAAAGNPDRADSGGQSGQMGQAQAGQQGGNRSNNRQQQRRSSSRPTASMDARMRGANPQQLQQTIDRLQQALQDMRNAASSQQAGTPQGEAEARRAADRLKEAQQMLAGLAQHRNPSNEVDELARQADELARRQQDFEDPNAAGLRPEPAACRAIRPKTWPSKRKPRPRT